MNTSSYTALILLSCLSMAACVSNKKYLAAREQAHQDSLRLADYIAAQHNKIGALEGKVNQLKSSSDFTSSQLNQSQEEIAQQKQRLEEQQARLKQLQTLIDQQKVATETLRSKIADAMKGFSDQQLSVHTKNGRVYVSMQESLLFPSASAVVNAKGKEALGVLAQVLNQNPDINIIVEGHTDSLRIHTARFEDNWSLSVARATAITRILTQDDHVAPQRITASGRSQFDPVSDNVTPEGRAQNRRTEIILAPRLDELMQLIQG
ncbi:MAG: OmpA family protein [Bacteroidetes bacterium]|nr:OmpA family protein [Bacteroidota bacterium]MBS1629601.1 OmpA family protein [Bacteroidota bacterium]